MLRLILLLLTLPQITFGQEITAARNLAARTLLQADDIVISGPIGREGIAAFIGKELRNAIYRGRPITAQDLTEPALIERNAIVKLIYKNEGLSLETEGKALERAAFGAPVRVMNLTSKTVILGKVSGGGIVEIEAQR